MKYVKNSIELVQYQRSQRHDEVGQETGRVIIIVIKRVSGKCTETIIYILVPYQGGSAPG